jgi:hypothetical protein
MSLISSLLSLSIRIINIPARTLETLVDEDSKLGDADNTLSKPLETLARSIEEATK